MASPPLAPCRSTRIPSPTRAPGRMSPVVGGDGGAPRRARRPREHDTDGAPGQAQRAEADVDAVADDVTTAGGAAGTGTGTAARSSCPPALTAETVRAPVRRCTVASTLATPERAESDELGCLPVRRSVSSIAVLVLASRWRRASEPPHAASTVSTAAQRARRSRRLVGRDLSRPRVRQCRLPGCGRPVPSAPPSRARCSSPAGSSSSTPPRPAAGTVTLPLAPSRAHQAGSRAAGGGQRVARRHRRLRPGAVGRAAPGPALSRAPPRSPTAPRGRVQLTVRDAAGNVAITLRVVTAVARSRSQRSGVRSRRSTGGTPSRARVRVPRPRACASPRHAAAAAGRSPAPCWA